MPTSARKLIVQFIAPQAYFLTDEKVGKESPRNFRMFLGLFRRTKRDADKMSFYEHLFRIPLGNSPGGLCVSFLCA